MQSNIVELKPRSERSQLAEKIKRLNKRSGPVISTAKYGKPPSALSLEQMRAALAEWETVMAERPRTSNWQDVPVGNESVVTSGDGQIWTVCLGFYTSREAGRWLEFLLREQHCKFAIVREAKRCKQPFEIKAWQPSPELFDAMHRGTLQSLRSRQTSEAEYLADIETDIDRF